MVYPWRQAEADAKYFWNKCHPSRTCLQHSCNRRTDKGQHEIRAHFDGRGPLYCFHNFHKTVSSTKRVYLGIYFDSISFIHGKQINILDLFVDEFTEIKKA